MKAFVGFSIAGALAASVSYGLFAFLYAAGWNYLAASASGFFTSIFVSFTINRHLVFRSSYGLARQLSIYLAVYTGALVAQLALLEYAVRAGLNPFIGNAIALGVVAVGNFFTVKRFVFTQSPKKQE